MQAEETSEIPVAQPRACDYEWASFPEGERKEFGGFPSGHLHIKASRDVSACIFIRGGQEREGKKFCERPSWLPKNFSLVTSIPPASQGVWSVHAGLSVLYSVFPQVNLSRGVGPTQTQSDIFTVESKKKSVERLQETNFPFFPSSLIYSLWKNQSLCCFRQRSQSSWLQCCIERWIVSIQITHQKVAFEGSLEDRGAMLPTDKRRVKWYVFGKNNVKSLKGFLQGHSKAGKKKWRKVEKRSCCSHRKQFKN